MSLAMGTLDRRTLAILLGGVAIILILRFGVYSDSASPVVAATESVPTAERRLERLRELAGTVPGKEAVLKQARAELAARENGILKTETAAQAQAQLLDIIRQVASANGIDARGAEELRVTPLANNYGEVSVAVTFSCAIEQLVNFLAALANEPQILATKEITVSGGNDKKKIVQVRLSLSGVVPKKLVPEKKGLATF
ncbi:MAG TPA: type II secretion system protein GspM [Bryobacteraceae bacterium]|nr:type II secretion system protein GspM [Bryobacteraceae bacterium]